MVIVGNITESLDNNGAEFMRYKFKEMLPTDLTNDYNGTYLLQPKWDGWFMALSVDKGIGTLYSRTCKYREGLDCKGLKDNIYLGELIENTQWSYSFNKGEYHGKFIIFDSIHKSEFRNEWFPKWIELIESIPLNPLDAYNCCIEKGFEGMIMVDYYNNIRIKVKKIIEDDFVIMGFEDSTSDTSNKLGGMVRCLIYGDGKKCIGKCSSMNHELKVDMFKDKKKYIGRTIKVSGKEIFKSGALRHPVFVCFRDIKDKKIEVQKKLWI